jgi:hypothetical protein
MRCDPGVPMMVLLDWPGVEANMSRAPEDGVSACRSYKTLQFVDIAKIFIQWVLVNLIGHVFKYNLKYFVYDVRS